MEGWWVICGLRCTCSRCVIGRYNTKCWVHPIICSFKLEGSKAYEGDVPYPWTQHWTNAPTFSEGGNIYLKACTKGDRTSTTDSGWYIPLANIVIDPKLFQCWINVFDGGSTIKHFWTILVLIRRGSLKCELTWLLQCNIFNIQWPTLFTPLVQALAMYVGPQRDQFMLITVLSKSIRHTYFKYMHKTWYKHIYFNMFKMIA